MIRKSFVRSIAVISLTAVAALGLQAQGGAALTGTVSSGTEGKIEGVLVTARRDGANFDVTVVSDSQGKYSFPRSNIGAGRFTIKIRAAGYDLTSPNTVAVPEDTTATLELSLGKAADMTTQLSSTEWLMTMPGTDEQKAMVQKQILSCTYCHSMERIVKSRHTAEQFVPVIKRMLAYYPDGSMAGTEGRGRAKMEGKEAVERAQRSESWGVAPGVKITDLATYLATINMSGGKSLPSDLKTLPRPKGKATRVIITQYDMPRRDTVPHDSDMDSKGNVWYTDQSDYYVGRFDPKTGAFKEWPLPKASTHAFGGASDVQVDRKDRVWFTVTSDKVPGNFGMPGYFDPGTEQYQFVDLGEPRYSQFMAIAADGALVLGGLKIDPETKTILDRFEWTRAANAPPGMHYGYEPAMDSRGNWYITDFGQSYMVQVDAKTKQVNWLKTPTVFSEPRRGKMDSQDRFWFGEYTGDKIGMLDTKTSKITEFDTGIKWSGPYTVTVPDAAGRVYSPAGAADRIFRLDPATGETIAYLMPTKDFDSKQVSIDPLGKKVIWLANTRNARLMKIEPLD